MFKKLIIILVLSFGVMFLGACTNIDRFDNSYYTNPIPGGVQNYVVDGKHYHVLSSSKGYDKKGTASWYGPQFDHKITSSGERFDMYKLTAASKVLPLCTYVLVTNLKNGKQVIVKVNDRGPFVSTRLLDLSYGAAKKLGMIGGGTTQVEVKAISPVALG